jgi:hypothetical protein
MGRLVRKPQIPDLDAQIAGLEGVLQSGIGGIGGMQMAGARPGDNYLERMAKDVPAEIIAFSMVINSILEQAVKTGGKNAVMAGFPVTSIAAGALVLALILTPLFCWYVREDGDPGSSTPSCRRSPFRSGPISWAPSLSRITTTVTWQ